MSILSRFSAVKGNTPIYVSRIHRFSVHTITDLPSNAEIKCEIYFTYDSRWYPISGTQKTLTTDDSGYLTFEFLLGPNTEPLAPNVFQFLLPRPPTSPGAASSSAASSKIPVFPHLILCVSFADPGNPSAKLFEEYHFQLYAEWDKLCIDEARDIFEDVSGGRHLVPRSHLIEIMEQRWRHVVGFPAQPNLMEELFAWVAIDTEDGIVSDFVDADIFVSSDKTKRSIWLSFNSLIELYMRVPLVRWLVTRGEFFTPRFTMIVTQKPDEEYFHIFRLGRTVVPEPILVLDIYKRNKDDKTKFDRLSPNSYVTASQIARYGVYQAFAKLENSSHHLYHQQMTIEDMHVFHKGVCRPVMAGELVEIDSMYPLSGPYLSRMN